MIIVNLCLYFDTDKPVTEKIRSRSSGNGRTIDTTSVDVGPIGHDVLYRERRIFRGRRSDRRAHTTTRRYGTRSLSTRRGVEGRDRG